MFELLEQDWEEIASHHTENKMKILIRCHDPERIQNLSDLLMFESNSDPVVVVNYDELDERGTLGAQVAQIDVVRTDGSVSRFWVKVRAAKRGRVECEVACNDLNKPQSRKKSIFGSWFKRNSEPVS